MTKQIYCGKKAIGGGAPITVQSMTNVDSHDEEALLRQIGELAAVGCDIVRIAIPDMEAARTLGCVRRKTEMPLVADIHFDHRLAIAAIENGADKIRINPGNIGSREKVRQVVEAAKAHQIPIRVGVNSGSLEKDILEKNGGVTAEGLAESALRSLALIEDMDFDDLAVSLKSSDVRMNCQAHRIVAAKTTHPIHIGITEAGTVQRGKVKSAVGIGALLMEGIGDTLRVSLTADPVEEVRYGIQILEAAGLRYPKVNLISCPTCGRTKVDLQGLAEEAERRLADADIRHGLTVAIMGCAVNGPGEAREADYGIAGGQGKGVIFAKGQLLLTVPEEELIDQLMKVMEEHERIIR